MEKIIKLLNKKIKKYTQRIKVYIDFENSNEELISLDVYVNETPVGFLMLDTYDDYIKLYSTHLKCVTAEDIARIMLAVAETLEALYND